MHDSTTAEASTKEAIVLRIEQVCMFEGDHGLRHHLDPHVASDNLKHRICKPPTARPRILQLTPPAAQCINLYRGGNRLGLQQEVPSIDGDADAQHDAERMHAPQSAAACQMHAAVEDFF